MKTARTPLRKTFRFLLLVVAVAGVAIALLPVWFPWVLKPALNHYGLHFAAYERHGYSRFALTRITGEWQKTKFAAGRAECGLPVSWLRQKFHPDTNAAPLLAITDWRLTIPPGEMESDQPGTNSTLETLDEILSVATILEPTLLSAKMINGKIQANSWSLILPEVKWTKGRLTAEVQPASFGHPFRFAVSLENKSSLSLNGTLDAYDTALEAKLQREPAAWQLSGQLVWLTNRAGLSAKFGSTGWWPLSAELNSRQMRVPTNFFGMGGYEDPAATLRFTLISNRFDFFANVMALPVSQSESALLPKVQATLHVTGDPDSATVKQFEVHTPWLVAELTSDFGVRKSGNLLTNAAALQVAFDLSKLPGTALTGTVDGFVRIELTDAMRAMAHFEISGTNIFAEGLHAKQMEVEGDFDWPTLKLHKLNATFGDDSTLALSGASDLPTRRITEARWKFSGNLLKPYLGGVDFKMMEASGQFQGEFSNLVHSGKIAVAKVQIQPWSAFDVRAEWQGTNLHLAPIKVESRAGDSMLLLAGKINANALRPPMIRLELDTASFNRGGQTLYALAAPSVIEFQMPSNASPKDWALSVDHFDWAGEDRELSLAADLHWPARGSLKGSAREFQFADFADFIPTAFTNSSLAQLRLEANWSNGPVRSELSFTGAIHTADARVLGVTGSARTGDAIEINQLTLRTELAPALMVDGTIPVTLQPGATNGWLVSDEKKPLNLHANLVSDEDFSVPLGEAGQIKISRPKLRMTATGTLAEPSAMVNAQIGAFEWRTQTHTLPRPRMENFVLAATLGPTLLELRELHATIDGQPLEAHGEWPVNLDFWKTIFNDPSSLDWSKARGQFSVRDAQVSALARYLPSVLAPEGQISATLTLEPEKKLAGLVSVTNAATRPLGDVSPLRDVAVRVRFQGETAALEEFRGKIGGQPVQATGYLSNSPAGKWEYQVQLQGSNVPFARSLEFLLRGDFDLNLKGNIDSAPLVSGEVNLRDGLYVQYATALMLSRPERPGLRPPYFSVTNQPFADWKMDLGIRGDRFLRVRMPVFNGTVSANLKMRGTLHDPVLTGDARINAGRLFFPFGTLAPNQAYASLDGSDARGPELFINASGKNYGYDVRLEVTGPADGANVAFSSTPPLSSEEILLMLTTGELPKGQEVFSTKARAGRLATFVGKDFLSRFSGDEMAGERLVINTGENLTQQGQTTYSIEYQLTDRWSLIGEYDRFSAINASVKWKLFSH